MADDADEMVETLEKLSLTSMPNKSSQTQPRNKMSATSGGTTAEAEDRSKPTPGHATQLPQIEIDATKLVPLPILPTGYEDAPFLHRSYITWQMSQGLLEGNPSLLSNQRDVCLGEMALKHCISRWLMRSHPTMEPGAATHIRIHLTSKEVLGRLCRYYKLQDRMLLGPEINPIHFSDDSKIWCDTYEAYMGVLDRASFEGKLSSDTVQNYINKLVNSGALSNIDEVVLATQGGQGTKKGKWKGKNKNSKGPEINESVAYRGLLNTRIVDSC